jgi:hypothetical protein
MRTILMMTIAAALTNVSWAEPITTGSLVEQMIDMHTLAKFPEPAYKTVQFASNDRRSNVPGGVGWFDNSDGFGKEPVPNFEKILRKPGKDGIGEYLICDVKGPGAIVREWTAMTEGNIDVYLDGADKPVWTGHAMAFLLKPWGIYEKEVGLEEKDYGPGFYQKNAAYCPFPFAKGCRIVWTGDVNKIHFYQIQIRLYDEGAQVQTFQLEDLKTYADTIKRVAKVLADPKGKWSYRSKAKPVEIKQKIAPIKDRQQIMRITGAGGMFERLTLKVEADDMDRALRQMVMHIVFDGYPWGQVQSPIGDFFGAAPGINPYDSVPFTVEPDGTMTCRYVMPFKKSCEIFIENFGDQMASITGEALMKDHTWDDERSMHFRARWRVDHDLVGSGGAVQDMPYLIANGKGVYVGSSVYLLNPNDVPSPGGSWWGEGDEKIFVDDDVQPSTFGTGSEDYYNYSWSQPAIWLTPYAGQPRNDGPANRGFVTNFRWHVLDPLPFKYRMSFYMELYPHERNEDMSYARIGYHYGRPGIMDDHVAITSEDVRHLQLPENWQPAARGGAHSSFFHQAEDLEVIKGEVSIETGRLYSGGKLMVWKPKAKGDELQLKVPVDNDQKWAVMLVAVQRAESGPISVKIDDQQLRYGEGTTADLHVPHRVLLRAIRPHDVWIKKQGDLPMTIRYEGEVDKPGSKSVGIDFIWLQRR